MTFFFSPEVTLAFVQDELLFLDNAFLDQFLVFCVADGLEPFLI